MGPGSPDAGAEVEVVEVDRPKRQARRRRGEPDTDAAGRGRSGAGVPTSESSSSSRSGHFGARSDRRVTLAVGWLSIRDLIMTAPEELRGVLGPLFRRAGGACWSSTWPGTWPTPSSTPRLPCAAWPAGARPSGRDGGHLRELTARATPVLRGATGWDPTGRHRAPRPGTTQERDSLRRETHSAERLSRDAKRVGVLRHVRGPADRGIVGHGRPSPAPPSGNRQAHHARCRIVLVRLRSGDPATRRPRTIARRMAEGERLGEIVRCLTRHVAREIDCRLVPPTPTRPEPTSLRPGSPRISLETLADALGSWPTRTSALEGGIRHRSASPGGRGFACRDAPKPRASSGRDNDRSITRDVLPQSIPPPRKNPGEDARPRG